MDALQEYCSKWDLSNPVFLESTFTSHLYKVTYQAQPAILKLLTEIGRRDEATAVVALQCFQGQGSVQVLKFDEGAQLLEFIDGIHLESLVDNGEDQAAVEIICDVIHKLHSYSGPVPAQLISMKENFRSLFKLIENPQIDPMFFRGAQVATHLIESPQNVKVLHGDLHHKNIMHSSTRGWLAIDPKCLYGESTYDLANLFFNPFSQPALVETPERIKSCVELFSKEFSIEPARILDYAFAYGCLSTAFCIEDGVNPDRRFRITKLIESVRANDQF